MVMLKVYDPRRHDPSTKSDEGRKRAPPSAVGFPSDIVAPSEKLKNCALAAYDLKQDANISSCFGFGNKQLGFAPLVPTWHTKHFSDMNNVTLPADVSRNGSVIGSSRPSCRPCLQREPETRSRPRSAEITRADRVHSIAPVTSSSILGLAIAGPSMSHNKISITWHSRERLRRASSLRPAVSGPMTEACGIKKDLAMDDSKVGCSGGRGTEIEGRAEGVTRKMEGVNAAGKRRANIDAVQLFRRKKQLRHNITYTGWTERYDRKTAKLAALKRRQRKKVEREEDLRRRRAKEEFQKWLRKHAISGSKVRMRAGKQGAKTPRQRWKGSTGVKRNGAGCKQRCRDVVREGPLECAPLRWRLEDSANRKGKSEDDTEGQGPESVGETKEHWSEKRRHEKTMTAEGAAEEKRIKIDRAFREWLKRKRKQDESERLAREQREVAFETQRKLEASRRWKKRPVVCAYTHGATLGAWQ